MKNLINEILEKQESILQDFTINKLTYEEIEQEISDFELDPEELDFISRMEEKKLAVDFQNLSRRDGLTYRFWYGFGGPNIFCDFTFNDGRITNIKPVNTREKDFNINVLDFLVAENYFNYLEESGELQKALDLFKI